MSSEEPKNGPEHLKNAKDKLEAAQDSLQYFNYANGRIQVHFFNPVDMNFNTTTTLTGTGSTGNITVSGNVTGGAMHQDDNMIRPVSDREKIYKVFADHVNDGLRDENTVLKSKVETAQRLRQAAENLNCELSNRNKALERDAKALVLANELLQRRGEVQAHNLDELQMQYAELKEAHTALRSALKELEESDTFNADIATYEQQVDALTHELERSDADKRQLQAVCDTQLAIAREEIEALRETQLPEWETLSLPEKVERLSGGMTVWQVSSGQGPFRTIMESQAKSPTGSTFGMRVRDVRGKERVIEVTDLTPYEPEKVERVRPSRAALLCSLSPSATAGVLAYFFGLPVGLAIAAVLFVVTLAQVRELRRGA